MPRVAKPRIFILPAFRGADSGEGGIRRVVEAQHKYFPEHGLKIVDTADEADILLMHASHYVEPKPGQILVAQTHGLYTMEYEWERWSHKVNRDCIDVMLKADVVLSPSEWVSQYIRRGLSIPAITVYHGIDSDDVTPLRDSERTAVSGTYVLWNKSRVDPVCDPEPLNELARRLPQTTFVTTYGASAENVRIVGRVPYNQSLALVRHSGVYLATTRETMGIGTLEAMAAGVPILGWNWGGQREIIRHKVDGWLARPGDYDDLEAGLLWCQNNRETAGVASRARAQEFSWEKAAALYADVFKDALSRKKAQSVRVSVVIPCYNMMNMLPDAIDSVLASEDAPSFEVVVVDDASTDSSLFVAQSYAEKDSRVRIVHNKENLYLAGALNAGINAAKGEYVMPLDADNMIGPHALNALSQYLDKDRALDIAYGKMQVREPSGREYVSDWPPKTASMADQLQHKNQISSTALYRKKVWERIGGYRRRCRTAEDADFWTRALSFGARGSRVTDQVTLIYRDRPDSMSHVEKDWDWTAWYPWSRHPDLLPPAVLAQEGNLSVPSFEPIVVSVIIPCTVAHHQYVIDAIDSLVAQTFQNWEAIVVLDHTESAPNLPPFVRVLRTQGQQGPAVARNIGITAARGRLLFFLDADDYLAPSALDTMLGAQKINGGYIYSDWYAQEAKRAHATKEYNCSELLKQMPHAVSILVPRAAMLDIGGFDEKLDAWEDWDFLIALAAKGHCGTRVPYPLLYYREHLGSRREELYARRAVLAENIKAKWIDYIEGREELMACGACGAKNQGPIRVQQQTSQMQTQANNVIAVAGIDPSAFFFDKSMGMPAVQIEYVGQNVGPVTYRGAATGRRYRFGHDDSHRVQPVAKDDLDGFIYRGEFQVAKPRVAGEIDADAPFLEAAGPPKRG